VKPRPAIRRPRPQIVTPPPEFEGLIKPVKPAVPTQIGWD